MQLRHLSLRVVAVGLIAFTALGLVSVLWPRLAQLKTATTSGGGVMLIVVGSMLVIAVVAPVAALSAGRVLQPSLVLSWRWRPGVRSC